MINELYQIYGCVYQRRYYFPVHAATLAIGLGTAIMAPDPVFGGLAIALIFSAISSALLVVFIVLKIEMNSINITNITSYWLLLN